MPDWNLWNQLEQEGKLTAQEQAMLARAREQRLTPAPSAPYQPRGGESPGSIDPTTGMRLPTTPAETEQTFQGMAEGGVPVARTMLREALGIGLPVAGTVAGTAVGGPMGAMGGEMAGSYGARKLNVALGLEEPGMVGDIAAAALPPAVAGIGKVIKGVAKRLPGVSYGMQELGTEEVRAIAPALRPKISSDTLYHRVAQENPPVDLHEVGKVAHRMLTEQMKLAPEQRSAPIVNAAQGWLDMATSPNGADFQSAWLAQKQLRQHIAGVGGLDEGARRQLDAAIMKDFEHTQGPASAMLKAANKNYRKERALEDLVGMVEGNITGAVQGQGTPRINAGAIEKRFEKALREDDLFAGAFTKLEQEDIASTLTEISKYPALGASPGASYGSGGVAGIGGWAGGTALGLDPQTAAIVPLVMTVLPFALVSQPGRTMVKRLAKSGRLMTPEGAAALRGFARTTGQDLVEPTPE
jgi:hypothetical protein